MHPEGRGHPADAVSSALEKPGFSVSKSPLGKSARHFPPVVSSALKKTSSEQDGRTSSCLKGKYRRSESKNDLLGVQVWRNLGWCVNNKGEGSGAWRLAWISVKDPGLGRPPLRWHPPGAMEPRRLGPLNWKDEIRNSKWFDKLTILSYVEGDYPGTEIQRTKTLFDPNHSQGPLEKICLCQWFFKMK